MNTNENKSALSVNQGIPQPPSVSLESVEAFKNRKKFKPNFSDLTEGILRGDRVKLSQAITLIESTLPLHQELAQQIIEKCLPYSGKSLRIGITGVPGVGKSTFIESFGLQYTKKGHKLAVLAIDPSSGRTQGSILGDKTRMETLSVDQNAYIRPSPSSGSLGGVARKTRETIILCEAAGYDRIIIETVGVGQSETAVHSMVDFFLLLMLAGAGDELQGIKRGIMEMADGMAITKADGENKQKAEQARVQYQNALHLFPISKSAWSPKVHICSAVSGEGIDDVADSIENYVKQTCNNGYFDFNRQHQSAYWMKESIEGQLKNHFYQHPNVLEKWAELEKKVLRNEMSSFIAAKQLLDLYLLKEKPIH